MPSKAPLDWKVVRLGDVAEVRKGTSFTSKKLVPGNVPVIAGGKKPAYYHNIPNRHGRTITVSASGAYAGFVAYHSDPIFATDCTTIQSSSEHSDTQYLYHYLKHRQEDIYRRKNGSAQPHIYPRDIASLKIALPPVDEQLLIAQILDSVDKAYRKTEELRGKTEQLREAILHKLLTRGLPGHHTEWKEVPWLGTIPANWQVVCLSDILIINQPGAWGNQPTPDNPGVPVLRATNLTRDGRIVLKNVAIRMLSERDLQRRLMQDGDIILEKSGGGPEQPVGRVGLVKDLGTVYCSNFLQHLRVDKQLVIPQFVVQALCHRYIKGLTHRLEHRTTGIRNLDFNGYLRLPFPLPSLAEQQIIVNILQQVDRVVGEYKIIKTILDTLKLSLSDILLVSREGRKQ